MNDTAQALKKLREPFPKEAISKLPKPTKQQTDEVRSNFKAGVRCSICGGWHHPKVVHLDYVGHAALTDRLLSVDPLWNWEPLAMDDKGLPLRDSDGGMWIKLTVCGITRLGYGDAEQKKGPAATKEVIGDALRNAAMRFGCALDLWHKGDLPAEEEGDKEQPKADYSGPSKNDVHLDKVLTWIDSFTSLTADAFTAQWMEHGEKAMGPLPKQMQDKVMVAKKEMDKYLQEKK